MPGQEEGLWEGQGGMSGIGGGCFGMHPQPTPPRITGAATGFERAPVALEWLVSASALLGRPQRWLGHLPSRQEKEE